MGTNPETFHYNFTIASNGVQHGMRLGGQLEDPLLFHAKLNLLRPLDLWGELNPRLKDLLQVVQAVHAADRLSPRHESRDGHGWARRLQLRLQVHDLDFWAAPQVTQQLAALLGSLTTDEWHIDWKERHRAAAPRRNRLFDMNPAPATYVLSSGGLDSFGAVCDLAYSRTTDRFALVSTVLSNRMADVQNRVATVLDERFRGRVFPVTARIALSKSVRGAGIHRSRSFVFQALGAVSAWCGGARELYQCENGVASLCLPLCPGSFPWATARGVHPGFLHEMGAFLSLVFGSDFQIRNPYLLTTKAELCASIPRVGLEEAIRATVSCDRYPQRLRQHPVCGKCPPCILRRQTLYALGMEEYDHNSLYRYDVTRPGTKIPREARGTLNAMLSQRERIRYALAAGQPWQALTRSYPELDSAKRAIARALQIDGDQAQQGAVSMLSRYVEEWDRFPVFPDFPDTSGTGDRRRVRTDPPQLPTLPFFEPAQPAE